MTTDTRLPDSPARGEAKNNPGPNRVFRIEPRLITTCRADSSSQTIGLGAAASKKAVTVWLRDPQVPTGHVPCEMDLASHHIAYLSISLDGQSAWIDETVQESQRLPGWGMAKCVSPAYSRLPLYTFPCTTGVFPLFPFLFNFFLVQFVLQTFVCVRSLTVGVCCKLGRAPQSFEPYLNQFDHYLIYRGSKCPTQ